LKLLGNVNGVSCSAVTPEKLPALS